MQIVQYPHPALRHRSKPLKRVDAELREIVADMFQLMYQANGIGLAANQVDLPIRLFIINLTSDVEEGEEFVFINPLASSPKGSEEAEEGCLSLPGLYGQVTRPKQVKINAYNLQGEEVTAQLDGLMARVFQHELDHLDGVVFPDRMSETAQLAAREALDEFELEFNSRRSSGEIPNNKEIVARLAELEKAYC